MRNLSRVGRKHVITSIVGIVALGVLAGCPPKARTLLDRDEHLPETQDEAGSMHVAVLSATPWEDVQGHLSTNFPIDEKTALAEAVPTTAREVEQLLDAIRTGLRLALPTLSESTSRTETTTSTEPPSFTETRTRTEASGDVSQLVDDSFFQAQDRASLPDAPAGDLGRDPLLRRQAAAQLLQAVRLLNRSIQDAATRTGFTPYVVTFQVGLMPYARHQPYDVYSTISLFSGRADRLSLTMPKSWLKSSSDKTKAERIKHDISVVRSPGGGSLPLNANPLKTNAPPGDKRAAALAETLDKLEPHVNAELERLLNSCGGAQKAVEPSVIERIVASLLQRVPKDQQTQVGQKLTDAIQKIWPTIVEQAGKAGGDVEPRENPIVLPLLVTDNLEATSSNRSAAVVRELALEVAAQVKGVGVGLSRDQLQQESASRLAEDFNSLLTIGRVSENTFRIRLGAMNQGLVRHATIPRTHNIYMILLVPDPVVGGDRMMRFVARTEMRHARNGSLLKQRDPDEIETMVRDRINSFDPNRDIGDVSREVFARVQADDFPGFVKTLRKAVWDGAAKSTDAKHLRRPDTADRYADQLWLELTSIWNGSVFSQAPFELSPRHFPQWTDISRSLLLVDNGQAALVTIPGGEDLVAARLQPTLQITERSVTQLDPSDAAGAEQKQKGTSENEVKQEQAARTFTLTATGVEVLGGNRIARVAFPSVAKLALKDPAFAIHTAAPQAEFTDVEYLPAKSPDSQAPAVVVRVPATFIRFDQGGSAEVQVEITAADEVAGHFLLVDGANAALVSGSGLAKDDKSGRLVIQPGGGVATLRLGSLSELSPVVFSVVKIEPKKPAATIGAPVVRQAQPLPIPSPPGP